ncbi:MAG: PAS domain-containing protein, partial [Chloroflexi bacterium]|nr:PAS domain-containing protein [Chloroflexota bacterium]
EVWEDTFPLRGEDGQYRWFLSRAIPIRDEKGKVTRWFGTNTDITEQKQLEQQKEDFVGIASHELKTPVTSLKAYAQLLERRFRDVGDERASTMLKKMDTQLNKLTALITDLLDVTRIESGKLLLHVTSFDFDELVREIVEETQLTTTKHSIIQQLDSAVILSADRDRIGQVLTNLLTNAIKYSPQADSVVVKTLCRDEALIVSVQDFGIGIAKQKQQHIFERFFRVEGETQFTYPGLGIGLYISAEFVRRHHGSIWVESEEGTGATFSFSLPIVGPPTLREPSLVTKEASYHGQENHFDC